MKKKDYIIISCLGLFIIFYIFYHSIPLAMMSIVFLPVCLKYYSKEAAEKRRDFMTLQFRDFLYSLSSSFAAGRHMRDALHEARDSLGLMYDDGTPMMKEISLMINQIDESREPEEEVLRGFAMRSSVSDIQSFIDTYLISRMTGGDINGAIAKTSGMLIEKIGIEREIKVLTSQKRFEGRIISAMPLLVVLFLNIASPAYIETLYTTFTGRVIMTAALAGIAYSYYLTMKLTKIQV